VDLEGRVRDVRNAAIESSMESNWEAALWSGRVEEGIAAGKSVFSSRRCRCMYILPHCSGFRL
jgi:hypothetical protein